MARRPSFLAGTFLGTALAGLLAASLPSGYAGEPRGDVRLLVSCDSATRVRVLDALRALPVEVHDLATMQRVALEMPADLADVLGAWKAIHAAVAEAGGGGRGPVSVLRIQVADRQASFTVRAADLGAFDALRAALAKSDSFGGADVVRPAVTRTGSEAYEGSLQLTVAKSTAVPGRPSGPVSTASIASAIQGAQGRLVSVSSEQVAISSVGETRSQEYLIDFPDAVPLDQVMERLQAIPGVRVAGASWRWTSPKERTARATLRLAFDVPR